MRRAASWAPVRSSSESDLPVATSHTEDRRDMKLEVKRNHEVTNSVRFLLRQADDGRPRALGMMTLKSRPTAARISSTLHPAKSCTEQSAVRRPREPIARGACRRAPGISQSIDRDRSCARRRDGEADRRRTHGEIRARRIIGGAWLLACAASRRGPCSHKRQRRPWKHRQPRVSVREPGQASAARSAPFQTCVLPSLRKP